MSKRPSYIERSKKDNAVNKKAIIWVGAIFGVIVIGLAVLLALGK